MEVHKKRPRSAFDARGLTPGIEVLMHEAPYRLIPLHCRDGTVRAWATVDQGLHAWLSQWPWHYGDGYAVRVGRKQPDRRRRVIYLHRTLLGLEDDDPRRALFLNEDRLDYRIVNLRIRGESEGIGGDRAGDGIWRIPLRAHDDRIRTYALVDAADYNWLCQWRWSMTHGYAVRSVHGRGLFMHRALLGLVAGDGLEVDHIDGCGHNNQRANLRVVTHAQNLQNRRAKRTGSSRYRGVTRRPDGRWVAQANVGGKHHWLGSYATEAEAAAVAGAWRSEHMPYS